MIGLMLRKSSSAAISQKLKEQRFWKKEYNKEYTKRFKVDLVVFKVHGYH